MIRLAPERLVHLLLNEDARMVYAKKRVDMTGVSLVRHLVALNCVPTASEIEITRWHPYITLREYVENAQ